MREAPSPGAQARIDSDKPLAMPEFVPPQLCKLVERPPAGDDWAHEIKFDGYRMQLRVAERQAALRTRKGLDWTDKYQPIADAASALPDCIIDGEIVALDHNGAPDFAALQAAMSEGKVKDLVFFAFDLLFSSGKDLRELPLAKRKARLESLLDDARTDPTIRYVEHFVSGGDAVLRSACRMSLEGIISKQLSAPYRSGRGDSWTKSKVPRGARGGHRRLGNDQRPLPLASGRREQGRSSRLCRPRWHRLRAGRRLAASAAS